VLAALGRHQLFFSAALPRRILPPMFNRYAGATNAFGNHIDGAIRYVPGTAGERVRTDISCTLFLAEPEEYDGGELVIEDTYGAQRVKLPAGDMVLYPGTSVHRVEPVTRGARLASFFWVESMVRSDEQRQPPARHGHAPHAPARDGRRDRAGGDRPDRHVPQPAAPLGRRLSARRSVFAECARAARAIFRGRKSRRAMANRSARVTRGNDKTRLSL
jgi:hypothetical protein